MLRGTHTHTFTLGKPGRMNTLFNPDIVWPLQLSLLAGLSTGIGGVLAVGVPQP